MNVCILIGKIIEEVDFKFIYNSKEVSISKCRIQLINNSQIEIYGLNEMADYMYSKLEKGDIIITYGSLVNKGNRIEIEAKEIKKINSK